MPFPKKIISVLAVSVLLSWITGCSPSPSLSQPPAAPSTDDRTSAVPSSSEQEQDPSAVKGDGTLTVSLNITNPEQKQERYLIAFTWHDKIIRGKPIDDYQMISYEVSPDTPLTVYIEDLWNVVENSAYESGALKADLTVVRVEDTNLRNPLAEPVVLDFEDETTCLQGTEITLDMMDEPLTSLYPEGTLLIKIQQTQGAALEDQGGYVDFKYKRQNNGLTLTFGGGSAGPDYLVAFDASDFVENGIRDAMLSITDFNNNIVSNQLELHFDENGYCQEGQFFVMERLSKN
jgi:hypothetical protein